MPRRPAKRAEDLPTTLLRGLPKRELPKTDEPGGLTEFRFEQNLLPAAGMTHEREVRLVRELVGDARWQEAQTPPEGAPGVGST